MDEKKKTPSQSAEKNSDIEAMRAQLSVVCTKYITTFNKFPLVSKLNGVTDINEIINRNVNFEIETRKLQKKLNRYLGTINKMLEAGINANVLHQHFLGCVNIALQCQDLLCMKIFLTQAHTTFAEIIRYIREYLSFSKDIEKSVGEVSSLLKFIHPSIEFSEKFLTLEDKLLVEIENTISKLENSLKT
ncbi:MAG TPA: hypothetical protein VMV49_00035 [Candidatus Deferrimicrobium sp.]|nr:hypothetical protein [Candidatus Deferrimicrobium sp.]